MWSSARTWTAADLLSVLSFESPAPLCNVVWHCLSVWNVWHPVTLVGPSLDIPATSCISPRIAPKQLSSPCLHPAISVIAFESSSSCFWASRAVSVRGSLGLFENLKLFESFGPILRIFLWNPPSQSLLFSGFVCIDKLIWSPTNDRQQWSPVFIIAKKLVRCFVGCFLVHSSVLPGESREFSRKSSKQCNFPATNSSDVWPSPSWLGWTVLLIDLWNSFEAVRASHLQFVFAVYICSSRLHFAVYGCILYSSYWQLALTVCRSSSMIHRRMHRFSNLFAGCLTGRLPVAQPEALTGIVSRICILKDAFGQMHRMPWIL